MAHSPPRHLPLILVLAAVCAALGLGFGERWYSTRESPAGGMVPGRATAVPPDLSAQALVYPEPRVLAPFLLQRAGGGTLGNPDLRGAWTLVFFGFTNCPDVCPTALATMKQIEALRSDPSTDRAYPIPRLSYWFVSVDPERDTPAVLSKYAGYFSPAIVAATAAGPDVERLARDAGVVFMKSPQDNGDYTIDHSTQMLLVNPDGNLHAMWRPPHVATELLQDIARIASSRSGG